MSSIKIYLDNYDNICYAGQTLVGRVECHFNTKKYIRAIRISITGVAQTEWEDCEKYYNEEKKKHESRNARHYAEEKYFIAEYTLLQGGEQFKLPAGSYIYPFSYILPTNIPSSYVGHYGKILYCLQATVSRPDKPDYEDKLCLNVVSPLDLNTIPGLSDSVAISVDKTVYSCWCTKSGILTFDMSLPATGFVPGQEVSIGGHIENMTKVNVECVKFKIVGHIEFISQYPSRKTKYEEITVAECRESGVGAHGEKSWTSNIQIPENQCYPNLRTCGIMNVIFRLKATVVMPNSSTNLENEVPVTLGTIPLAGVNITFGGAPPSPQIVFALPPTAPPHEGSFVIPPYPTESNTYSTNEDINIKMPMATYPPVPSNPSVPVLSEMPSSSKGTELIARAPPSYDEANR